MSVSARIAGVTVVTKANIYFDGKVVSHTVEFTDGSRKTVGLIYPGSYHFTTAAPERMDIIAGSCRVKIKGQPQEQTFAAGTGFDVPASSAFDIAVDDGIAEYLCSYR